MTQADVQTLGGPSPALVRSLENGRADSLSASKRRDLERAVFWTPGSVEEILAGREPGKGTTDHTARYLAGQGMTYEEAYREKVAVPAEPKDFKRSSRAAGRSLDDIGRLVAVRVEPFLSLLSAVNSMEWFTKQADVELPEDLSDLIEAANYWAYEVMASGMGGAPSSGEALRVRFRRVESEIDSRPPIYLDWPPTADREDPMDPTE